MPTKRTPTPGQHLREALAPYVDLRKLRQLAAVGSELRQALHQETADTIPPELLTLVDALSVLLRPADRESISSPAEMAALLMVEMGQLDQEELRVVLLNTKNHLIAVVTVYRGTLNASAVRVAEVFKEAIRRNAAAVILAHNHPSSDPSPSSEDVAVTREIVEAGKLLGIEVLDHLVIGRARWVSLRERGLGFGVR